MAAVALGQPQSHRHITALPLLTPDDGSPKYTTLPEALAACQLTVAEGSHVGSVPELKVIDSGDQPVLLLDGEELSGAKQNRVLNTTILFPAKYEAPIPVSCTERGRWRYASA